MEAKSFCILNPGTAPWLVFPHGKRRKSKTFFNVPDGSYKVRNIKEMHRTEYMASYYGWLVLRDQTGKIFLLNPVSLQKIKLPTSNLGGPIYRILLSSPPTDPDSVIVFFCFENHSFSYFHLSDEKWIWRKCNIDEEGGWESISDAIYCNGKLYAYTRQRKLGIVDIDGDPVITWLGTKGPKNPPTIQTSSEYLVESLGEIFLLLRGHDMFTPHFLKFDIYKMNFAGMAWEQVDTLGDRVLFLGLQCSTSCSATASGIKRDCIYFTKPNDTSLYLYHLDRGTISVHLPCPNVRPPWDEPFWLMSMSGGGYEFEQAKQGRIQEDLIITAKNICDETKKVDILETSVTEEKEVVEPVPWSDLPGDILESIALQLFRVDFVHLTSVCRRWRSIRQPRLIINSHLSSPASNELPLLRNHTPWLMFFRKDDGMSNFWDPVYNQNYFINIPELSGSSLTFSKGGWVFMYKGYRSVFLFNPFIKAKIELPELEFDNYLSSVSFSSTPTSPDCIVFAVSYYYRNSMRFYIYHRGDQTWTEQYFDNEDNMFLVSLSNPVFYGGVFYILGHDGRLGVYDPQESTWTILTKPKSLKFCHCQYDSVCKWRNYLVESRGELLMVFVGFLGNPIRVFRLEFSKMEWVEVETLEDQMLMVGRWTSVSSGAVTKGIGNKVYFPMVSGKQSVFYSLEDSRCYPNSDFYKSEEYIYSTWIEPTWAQPSAAELNWSEL